MTEPLAKPIQEHDQSTGESEAAEPKAPSLKDQLQTINGLMESLGLPEVSGGAPDIASTTYRYKLPLAEERRKEGGGYEEYIEVIERQLHPHLECKLDESGLSIDVQYPEAAIQDRTEHMAQVRAAVAALGEVTISDDGLSMTITTPSEQTITIRSAVHMPLSERYKNPDFADVPTTHATVTTNISNFDEQLPLFVQDLGAALAGFESTLEGGTTEDPIDIHPELTAWAEKHVSALQNMVEKRKLFEEKLRATNDFPPVKIRDAFEEKARGKYVHEAPPIRPEDVALSYLLAGELSHHAIKNEAQMRFYTATMKEIALRYTRGIATFMESSSRIKEDEYIGNTKQFHLDTANAMISGGFNDTQIINGYRNLVRELYREDQEEPNPDILAVIINNINNLEHQGIGRATGSLISRSGGDDPRINLISAVYDDYTYDEKQRGMLISALPEAIEENMNRYLEKLKHLPIKNSFAEYCKGLISIAVEYCNTLLPMSMGHSLQCRKY